jgi:hypothetical protein
MRSGRSSSGLHGALRMYHAIVRVAYTASALRARHTRTMGSRAVADTITLRINMAVIAGVRITERHVVSSRYLASVPLSENPGTSSYRHLYDLIYKVPRFVHVKDAGVRRCFAQATAAL